MRGNQIESASPRASKMATTDGRRILLNPGGYGDPNGVQRDSHEGASLKEGDCRRETPVVEA